jgi:hypothetical protein
MVYCDCDSLAHIGSIVGRWADRMKGGVSVLARVHRGIYFLFICLAGDWMEAEVGNIYGVY